MARPVAQPAASFYAMPSNTARADDLFRRGYLTLPRADADRIATPSTAGTHAPEAMADSRLLLKSADAHGHPRFSSG